MAVVRSINRLLVHSFLALLAINCALVEVHAVAEEQVDAQVDASALPLENFLVRPRIREVKLSPAGDQVAYLQRYEHRSSVWKLDLLSGKKSKLLESRLIESLHFSNDGSGLFLETEDRLGFLSLADGSARWIFSFEDRLEPRLLGVDPVRPRHVLVAEESEQIEPSGELEESTHRLLRIDATGVVESVFERDQPIRQVLLSPDGSVRYIKRAEGLEQVILRLVGGQQEEVLRCPALDACWPVAYQKLPPSGSASESERLWIVSHGEGDLRSLYALESRHRQGPSGTSKPGTSKAGAFEAGAGLLIHSDPEHLADLRSIELDARGQPFLVTHDSDRRRSYGLESATEKSMATLRLLMPGARLKVEVSSGVWLVEESGARLPHPRYHVFDPAAGIVREILAEERSEVASIAEEALVEPQFLTFTASDGLPVHGLLYIPNLTQDQTAASAPVIMRVHGGPWNHVRNQWSSLSQFLVSRGYIVYEPNFRSSTGFGRHHITAAQGDFGDGRVQLDMLEGLEDLHARGYGDAERVAIIGHSFGGFSTLGALAFTPHRFVAGIASAPPIDLVRAIRDMPEDALQNNGIARPEVLKQLVGDLDDPAVATALRRRSPEMHLAATERPLLMLAGGADLKVDIVDVKHYAGALRGLGKDVSFLVDDDQGHSFENEVSLGAYFYLVERFLGHHLGGAVVASGDSRLEPYLALHMRFTGPSLDAALAGSRHRH